jgi:predicted enzyme related to lactoylglutathione lyase
MSDTTTRPHPGRPVSWFEIGTPDAAAAQAFYGQVFGWSFAQEGEYVLVTAGGEGPSGGIQDTTLAGHPGRPDRYAVICIEVPDVAASCVAAEDAGGKVLVPSQTMDTGLSFAYITDPAGNHVGLFSPPKG